MPRLSFLISVFVVSFLGFLVWMLPAELVVGRVDAVPLGPGRLQLSAPAGRVWDGQTGWRWQQLSGELDWELDWRGMTPGVRLDLREKSGRLRLQGWLSAGSGGDFSARDLELKVPVDMVTDAMPHGGADGYVSGRIEQLDWSGKGFEALSGELRYGGGQARWGRDGSASVPPLDARLFMEGGAARARVTDPDGRALAEARVGDSDLRFQVFRAWPALLGESGGGDPQDVVFEVTRPLPGTGGEAQ